MDESKKTDIINKFDVIIKAYSYEYVPMEDRIKASLLADTWLKDLDYLEFQTIYLLCAVRDGRSYVKIIIGKLYDLTDIDKFRHSSDPYWLKLWIYVLKCQKSMEPEFVNKRKIHIDHCGKVNWNSYEMFSNNPKKDIVWWDPILSNHHNYDIPRSYSGEGIKGILIETTKQSLENKDQIISLYRDTMRIDSIRLIDIPTLDRSRFNLLPKETYSDENISKAVTFLLCYKANKQELLSGIPKGIIDIIVRCILCSNRVLLYWDIFHGWLSYAKYNTLIVGFYNFPVVMSEFKTWILRTTHESLTKSTLDDLAWQDTINSLNRIRIQNITCLNSNGSIIIKSQEMLGFPPI